MSIIPLHKKLSIVIIEPQLIIAADILVQLTSLGHEVIDIHRYAKDAASAIKVRCPDLIFMNIGLYQNENDLLDAKILHHRFMIPLVILSADNSRSSFERIKKLPIYGFIPKPFHPKDIRQALHHASERMRLETKAQKQLPQAVRTAKTP